jgi:hypothetical protein
MRVCLQMPPDRRGCRWRSGMDAEDAPASRVYQKTSLTRRKIEWVSFPPRPSQVNPLASGPESRSPGSAGARYASPMHNRQKDWLRAAALTLLPVALIFPVVSAAHFEPAGPARVWPVLAFTPIAMWMETRAILGILGMYRSRHDPFLIAIVPLGLVSVLAYTFSGALLLLSLPALIHRMI